MSMDLELEKEFEEAKFRIKLSKWLDIMAKLSQFIKDSEYMKTGRILPDIECYALAQVKFAEAKKLGVYDELNNRVG